MNRNGFFYHKLSVALSNSLELVNLLDGRHTNDRKRRITKMWAAEIRPSASPPAVVALTEESNGINFAAGLSVVDRIVSLGPVKVSVDPVSQELRSLDLWSGNADIPFGGYTYRFIVSTTHLNAKLEFSRTTDKSRVRIAVALFNFVRATVESSDANSAWLRFINDWGNEVAFVQAAETAAESVGQ